jgi:hypothetical protein
MQADPARINGMNTAASGLLQIADSGKRRISVNVGDVLNVGISLSMRVQAVAVCSDLPALEAASS